VKIQHLVLDDDVHKALKGRKERIGVTVKEIGNSAIRAALSMPTMEDLIVEKLVETGKITRKDYDQAVTAAEAHVRAAQRKAIEAFRPRPGSKAVTVGSWVVRELSCSDDGSFCIFEHRARDAKKVAPPMHYHVESHVWAVVLHGKVLARTEAGDRVVGLHEWTYYPPGVAHCSAPLTRHAYVLGIVSPPERFAPGEWPDPLTEPTRHVRRSNNVR